jgi:hypothetical protein
MRIVNAELLMPTAEKIRNIVRMAYEAGRAKGREEAKSEQQGLAEPPDDAGEEVGGAEGVRANLKPKNP